MPERVKDGVQGPSPGSNCSSSGRAGGWGHRLRRGLRSVPALPSQEKAEPHKASPAWEELDRYRGGASRSWTPPPLRAASQSRVGPGAEPSLSARPAPAVPDRKPSPSAAAGVGRARGRVHGAEHRPWRAAPGPPFPGTPPLHGLTKRGRSGHAELGAGPYI